MLVNDGYTQDLDKNLQDVPVKRAAEKGAFTQISNKYVFTIKMHSSLIY